MKYAIVGTGAIGGYYGAKLVRAGKDVHFLLHSDYNYVCEHGLVINSCDGSFTLPLIQAYDSSSKMPKCDIVIVAMKSTNQSMIPDLIRPLLKDETLVLLIQNGIGLEPDLQVAFPNLHIAAGLAFICSGKTEPGIINHQCYGSINIGNYSCKNDTLLNGLISDFRESGIETNELEYYEARWKKAVWNMPFNGMTVVMNAKTNELLQCKSTRQLIRRQMMEVVNAAHAVGVTSINEDFVEKMIDMTDSMTPYSPSMKLDYDYNRPMEVKYLYSRPLFEAGKVECDMPCLRMLEEELLFIESQRGHI